MNIAASVHAGSAFVKCECIKGYAFKNVLSQGKCALFTVLSSVFVCAQGRFTLPSRFECLSPCCSPAC